MDDADPTLARERDRESRLADGVHRRRDDRNAQLDRARQSCPRRHVVREDARLGRHEQDVVERQPFLGELPVQIEQALQLVWTEINAQGKIDGTTLSGWARAAARRLPGRSNRPSNVLLTGAGYRDGDAHADHRHGPRRVARPIPGGRGRSLGSPWTEPADALREPQRHDPGVRAGRPTARLVLTRSKEGLQRGVGALARQQRAGPVAGRVPFCAQCDLPLRHRAAGQPRARGHQRPLDAAGETGDDPVRLRPRCRCRKRHDGAALPGGRPHESRAWILARRDRR